MTRLPEPLLSAALAAPVPLPLGRRRAVTVALCSALGLIVASVSMLNIALPDLARGTGADTTELLWIVNSYGLVYAALLLPAGAVGDLFGRRRLLIGGLAVFGLANAASCFTDTPSVLIAFRALAGAGAAAIMPTTLSVLVDVHAPAERAKVYVIWSSVVGVGSIVGLVVSGALLEPWSWESVLAFNAIAALVILVVCVVVTPREQTDDDPRADPVGALLSGFGLAGVVLGVIEAPEWGWTDPRVLLAVGSGIVLLVAFVVWESRRDRPMLDVALFRRREYGSGSLAVLLQWLVAFGAFFLLLQFLQLVRGLSPLEAGTTMLAPALAIGAFSPVAERVTRVIGPAPVAAVGMVVCAAGLVAVAVTDADTSFWIVALALVPFGAGIGITSVPATAMIMDDAPPNGQGMASAVNDSTREVGGALGIAVLGSILNDRYLSTLPFGIAEPARDSLASALALGDATTSSAAVDAFMNGFSAALVVAAAILLLGAVAVAAWGPRGRGSAGQDRASALT
ncbi:MAG: MFS transporter [Propionibacteriales bacterium]|nr:MFS transporter [Propionibacteriales bacterium]